jgi:hypothetical protein
MRAPVLLVVLALVGCDPGPASNSSGQLNVTGDASWGGALKGLGLKKSVNGNTYTCNVWLYDKLATYGGDEHPNDRDATYVFGLGVGRTASGLMGFPTGVFNQGDASKTINNWPSEVFPTFDKYEGFKHGDTDIYITGGTVTFTRFDAEKLVGSFSLTGLDVYCGSSGSSCTYAATGDFDITNVDCAP